MTLDLEEEFERRVRAGEHGADVVNDLVKRGAIRSRKQAQRTLEKWSDRGWWDYGTTLEGGWFTDAHPHGTSNV